MNLTRVFRLLIVAIIIFPFSCKNNVAPTISFSLNILTYDDTSKNFNLSSGHLDVTSGSVSLFSGDLQNTSNTVRVNGSYSTYHVAVSKSGYPTYEQDYSASDLAAFTANAPLSVKLFSPISFSLQALTYDDSSQGFLLTSAHLDVTSGSNSILSTDLQNITNTVLVDGSYSTYHIAISKSGYTTYEQDYSASDLTAFTANARLSVKLFPSSLTSGLIIWYPFSGNAQDASGNAQHGAISGATLTTDKNGIANSAYFFNGTTYVSVPSSLLTLNVYTYSIWADATALPSFGTPALLFAVADVVTTRNQSVSLSNNYGSADFVGWGGGSWNNAPTASATGVTTNVLPAINQWYHIVIIRSTDSVTLYVNNLLITSLAVPNSYPPFYGTTNIATIGINPSFVNGFTGKIDNFRIYNRVLSADEIGNLYNE